MFSATKMGSGTNIDRQTIEALPSIGGNIQDYMRLDPRVAFVDRASGSISAGGQNPRYNSINIDGVSASDTFGLEGNNMPTRRQPVSMDAIEAIDIKLSNYEVTTPPASGATVNAVTKSGTNEFHGSVYGNYRDGDWFGDNPEGQPFSGFTEEKTYGVTLGGPIDQGQAVLLRQLREVRADGARRRPQHHRTGQAAMRLPSRIPISPVRSRSRMAMASTPAAWPATAIPTLKSTR